MRTLHRYYEFIEVFESHSIALAFLQEQIDDGGSGNTRSGTFNRVLLKEFFLLLHEFLRYAHEDL